MTINTSISTLFDVAFGSQPDMDVWLLDHEFTHLSIFNTIIKSKIMTHNPLMEMDANSYQPWLQLHQDEHDRIAGLIGLQATPDLMTVDLKNEQEWQSWHDIHRDLHQQISAILGI